MDGISKTHHDKHHNNNAELLFIGAHILLNPLTDDNQQGIEGNTTQDAGIGQNGQESCVSVKVKLTVTDDGASEEGNQSITIKGQPPVPAGQPRPLGEPLYNRTRDSWGGSRPSEPGLGSGSGGPSAPSLPEPKALTCRASLSRWPVVAVFGPQGGLDPA